MAQRVLNKIQKEDRDARVLTLMAVTERGKGGDDQKIRDLLNLAITAKRGPQWICEKCNTVHANWEPICMNCSAMDSLEWKAPPKDLTNFTLSDDLLPFLANDLKAEGPLKKEVWENSSQIHDNEKLKSK